MSAPSSSADHNPHASHEVSHEQLRETTAHIDGKTKKLHFPHIPKGDEESLTNTSLMSQSKAARKRARAKARRLQAEFDEQRLGDDDDELDEEGYSAFPEDRQNLFGRSGGPAEHDASSVVYRPSKYETGYDINILLNELHHNTLRKLCLEDLDRTRRFTDYEMIAVAYALKHNTSVECIVLRALPVTDTSLVPLFEGLVDHPGLRRIEIAALEGKDASAKALVKLVTKNPHIVDVTVSEFHSLTEMQEEAISVAAQYNMLEAPDPQRNAFEAVVVESIDDLPLYARKFAKTAKETRSRPICANFLAGKCKYGSRCLLQHPLPFVSGGGADKDANAAAESQKKKIAADEEELSSFTLPDRTRVKNMMKAAKPYVLPSGYSSSDVSSDEDRESLTSADEDEEDERSSSISSACTSTSASDSTCSSSDLSVGSDRGGAAVWYVLPAVIVVSCCTVVIALAATARNTGARKG